MSKREDYISWDEYFMGVSLLASMRSKDPNTQVGACIVGDDNKIISVGYNGFPRGSSDDVFPWERSGANMNDTKYPFVCHAELNAICCAFPLQRVCKGDYSKRNQRGYIHIRQIRRNGRHKSKQKNV